MVMAFFRVEAFENDAHARQVLSDWNGPILFPLIKPDSPGGQWLRSAAARRDLSFMSGKDVLVIYPGVEGGDDYVALLEGLCDSCAQFGWDIRRIYPDPAVLVYDPANGGPGQVCRLKNPSGETVDEATMVRRALERLIRTVVRKGGVCHMMAAENRFAEWVYKIDDASPVMADFARRMAGRHFDGGFGWLVEALRKISGGA